MKNTIKLFLVVVLFCSTVFADGSMGAGGFTDDGSMGAGGRTCTVNCSKSTVNPNSTEKNSTNSVFEIVSEYLISIFG
ncbi:MAG TPA: hypothetical protein PKY59_00275 [Pyrinomonadaceae bacterium]|nr:hypothetical protein [Pyrinomonadaceae bacterium]